MILDQLSNAAMYYAIGERYAAGLRYLQETDFSKLAPGRYEIDGNNLFALVQHYETKPREKGFWEAHRQYADIQYVLEGAEHMGYSNIEHLRQDEFDASKDFLPLHGEGNFIVMPAGTFAIFAPQDAHMPGMAIGTPQPVKKVVVKVRL